jgi:spermidine synthase
VAAVFPNVVSYHSPVPTYASPWGFALAGAEPIEREPDPRKIDALLAARTTGEFRMFDGAALVGLMHTPKYIRTAIESETRIYTLARPPKFFSPAVPGS